ncbi:CDP-alcohol phosphatidyltransferase family protein [Patiriisocius marinus]|uniref:CDP-alcohol phosphatidyltransferase family protein n=1 Tax=Patiriisocius marinus TaxID=1397112 RepID=UPI00124D6FBF|nr:CDP-alcohol phosphatidyltransferase family protein [Patiriisocius marinus]
MIKQIPNLITSLNLLCGCVAIIFAVSGDLVAASFFAFTGIFFDFFDGFAARALNAQSQVGLELDSLADVVTSGVVPGIVMLQLLSESFTGHTMDIANVTSDLGWNNSIVGYLPFIGLLITVASAYRLAKFNVDTRQTSSFIGLPTPANTLLILSFPLILTFQNITSIEDVILNHWFLIGITLLSCVLLNAEIPLFAFKFKTWGFKENAIKYIFLIVAIALIALLKFIAIPIILLLYISISLVVKPKS